MRLNKHLVKSREYSLRRRLRKIRKSRIFKRGNFLNEEIKQRFLLEKEIGDEEFFEKKESKK